MPLDTRARALARSPPTLIAGEVRRSFADDLVALLPRLRIQALALTRNHSDVDDLVQAAVTSALAAKASFTPGTNFGAWMYRILRNRFLSDRRGTHDTVGLDDATADALQRPASQEHDIALEELHAHLARLSPDQRTALIMVSVQGLSYQDVADAMGCAVGTAKCRVFRARRQLELWLLGTDGARRSKPAPVSAGVRRGTTDSLPQVANGPRSAAA
ncbi:sigma-70 family RNA polymerase sigma factor [Roseomonas oryzicola]|uniref:Sigma-70 family RNA polymerase sigma factor n=2 Tax=Neoroseomonas oryzicola TaxID=535904 RepID=A0A9X9WQK6_9PROT|nr:sigma-70 family RNA polymerase sigma factor [Neoroseomonas oryzicola]MBR0662616.1 sigma-70 family RNA polymerase sigma factor [Neoroseomonas oryzicola]NKE19752.1 sigma-70 family RNA polymerase sigma factor [Neoroseomonas oryzicola]